MTDDLTSQQKSRFRKAYRGTYSAYDHVQALKNLYAKYRDLYGVEVDVLHAFVSEELKKRPTEYAALQGDLVAKQAATAVAPAIPPQSRDLTAEEVKTLVAAYRETFASPDRFAAVDRFLATFATIFGTPHRVLKEKLALDEERHVEEYRILRGDFAPQDRKTLRPTKPPAGQKKAKRKINSKTRKPRKVAKLAVCSGEHFAWEYCSACEGHNNNIEETNNSVRFEEKRGATRMVRGGLPGHGKRN